MDKIAAECCGSCEHPFDYGHPNCARDVDGYCKHYVPRNPIENPLIIENLIKIHAEQMTEALKYKKMLDEMQNQLEIIINNAIPESLMAENILKVFKSIRKGE